MRAEIITIGDELLSGEKPDTNSQYLAERLHGAGIDLYRIRTIPDNPEAISANIRDALKNSRLVITTGGLGPTEDDLTLKSISRALKKSLILDKGILASIRSHFRKRLLLMPLSASRQAYVPKGSLTLPNRVGTAPGIIIKVKGAHLVLLPGPPREVKPLVEKDLIPYLKKLRPKAEKPLSQIVKTVGVPESIIHEKIFSLISGEENLRLGSYPGLSEVALKLTSTTKKQKKARAEISGVLKRMKSLLGDSIYGFDDETLESVVAKLLLKKKLSLAVAESATGGLISHRLTNVPGSSRYFKGGIIAYSNEAKIKELKVSAALIKKYGAVSEQVATAMAKEVRKLLGADLGLGVTGICGPGGGTRKKPVGLVYIALAALKGTRCEKFKFIGNREAIKFQTSQAALNLIREELLGVG